MLTDRDKTAFLGWALFLTVVSLARWCGRYVFDGILAEIVLVLLSPVLVPLLPAEHAAAPHHGEAYHLSLAEWALLLAGPGIGLLIGLATGIRILIREARDEMRRLEMPDIVGSSP